MADAQCYIALLGPTVLAHFPEPAQYLLALCCRDARATYEVLHNAKPYLTCLFYHTYENWLLKCVHNLMPDCPYELMDTENKALKILHNRVLGSAACGIVEIPSQFAMSWEIYAKEIAFRRIRLELYWALKHNDAIAAAKAYVILRNSDHMGKHYTILAIEILDSILDKDKYWFGNIMNDIFKTLPRNPPLFAEVLHQKDAWRCLLNMLEIDVSDKNSYIEACSRCSFVYPNTRCAEIMQEYNQGPLFVEDWHKHLESFEEWFVHIKRHQDS